MTALLVFDERPNPVVQRVSLRSVVQHRLEITFEDEDGEDQPYDLDGSSVSVRLVHPSGFAETIPVTVDDEAGGVVSYEVATSGLAAPESYQIQVDLTDFVGVSKRLCNVQLEVSP